MEATGLVVGIVGLAGLFNNAIDWFDYIQIGKSFGTKVETSLLKLDNARLKLSRWGDAAGLSGGVDNATSLPPSIGSLAEIRQAERNLGQIVKLFEDARKVSEGFKDGGQSEEQNDLFNERTDMDLITASLHQKMVQISRKRQNRASLTRKAKFAVYGEAQLKVLIEDITKLTDDLVELFPATKSKQRAICGQEVQEFSENFRILITAATDVDDLLVTALSEILKPVENLNTFRNERSVVQQQGTATGGHFDLKVGMPW
ncbi:hypothetical protein FSARC_12389 [Fusarium sarcochroum]|uniref:Prion-inhibition and propagation HeLo domain-containing protein n=1 Tax=Fusarium sarcochroum TaxID=1208366 RepID=A0A8H4T8R9_9HYPO|nr:hypothetical protein FSARC_12389 [Fusarium sarcochroum]